MRTSPLFRSFIEIDKQIPESIAYSPFKLAEITDLPLGARGFHFIEEKGLLFVAVSEMKIASRIDSHITNVSGCRAGFVIETLVSSVIFRLVYDALGEKGVGVEVADVCDCWCSSRLQSQNR